jgi:hypothetical protein
MIRRFAMIGAVCAIWPTAVLAQQPVVLAVNAGISTHDHPQTVADNYRALADNCAKVVRGDVKVAPLLSNKVRGAIKAEEFPLMVIHTHHAVVASKRGATRSWHCRATRATIKRSSWSTNARRIAR